MDAHPRGMQAGNAVCDAVAFWNVEHSDFGQTLGRFVFSCQGELWVERRFHGFRLQVRSRVQVVRQSAARHALDADVLLPHLGEVVGHLQPQPRFRGGTERLG